mmetsp:Transcript_3520/g.5888  ORF Transcript_3520/g.5888 Transcript_3520/m.5888 type:complete len:116 (+) Transcript_3520:193-540(+)
MSIPKAPALELVGTTEVDITVQFKPLLDTSLEYELQWKQVQENWQDHGKTAAIDASSGSGSQEAVATPLNPGETYCVRLVCKNNQTTGEASKEMVVDTEQVGCTPTPDKSCCVVL